MILQERLQLTFQQLGWVRVQDVHTNMRKRLINKIQNISYLEILDKLLQEEIIGD